MKRIRTWGQNSFLRELYFYSCISMTRSGVVFKNVLGMEEVNLVENRRRDNLYLFQIVPF